MLYVYCSDIDECEAMTHDCDLQSTCANTHGGFECTCNHGYTGNGTYCSGNSRATPNNAFIVTRNCIYHTDIDECLLRVDDCGNSECVNTKGSFMCNCQTGFTGDPRDCRGT